MGFKFSYLCDLLSSLENNRVLKASTSAKNKNPDIPTVDNWFNTHRRRIDGCQNYLALLSCLFPEKRPDRVYRLQEPSLVKIIGRCLLLGASRKRDLDSWRAAGGGDLGQCVEIVMRHSENHIVQGYEVTVEEIDMALNRIASRCRFSAPKIRQNYEAEDIDTVLKHLYSRLPSRDAKWLTRMILKNYNPVVLPVNYVFRNIHFLLPELLLFQDSFEGAIQFLNSEPIKSSFPPRLNPPYDKTLRSTAMDHLAPKIGIKIGRPGFLKARSIKHCCRLVNRRKMAIERKYDGEYCQIHVDLDRGQDCIQIFSKSGKDSTKDKQGIHKAIKKSLRIGQADCTISKQCILEGELLVWSDRQKEIQEFHKLRKHISRAGKFIGTENDSPPQDHENLMFVFFDILLRDDNRCLVKPYNERQKLLKETVKTLAGQAIIAERSYINFSSSRADEMLTGAFAKAISKRWEGFVLKGWYDPYIKVLERTNRCCWIKLKKDYITGLGDTADFAIIGARYDAKDAHKLSANGIKPLLWTSFHVGCLENKRAVVDVNAVPAFRVVDVLNHNNMSIRDMGELNLYGQFQSRDVEADIAPFHIKIDQDGLCDPEVLFKTPFVVEVNGSGFDKPQNTNYYQLRFPRILKILCDRTFEDATTFEELQQMAEKARSAPQEDISQEIAIWEKKLVKANGKSEYIMDSSQRSMASSNLTASPSPGKGPLFPETNSSQELLPSNDSQAEMGLDTGTRQGKRKFHELDADNSKRKATRLDINWDELPLKSAKRKDYKTSNVAIFNDNSQIETSQDTVSTRESRCYLTDVVNLETRQKAQRGTSAVASENTPRTGHHLKMNLEENQSVTHESIPTQENKPASKSTEASQKQSSHVHTTSSRKVDHSVVQGAPNSPKQISLRGKHGSLFPMLVGRFFQHSNHPFQSVLTGIPMFVNCIDPFLDSVFAKWNERNKTSSSTSSPGERENPAIGIVFVDYTEASATDTAADIDIIGKRLAVLRQQRDAKQSKLADSHAQENTHPITPPEKGKILFLHWRSVLRDPSDTSSYEKFRWDKAAKSNFAGSIIWGYGKPRGYGVSAEVDSDHHHRVKRRRTSLDEKEGEFDFGEDVWASLDWREVLCLRGYVMEF